MYHQIGPILCFGPEHHTLLFRRTIQMSRWDIYQSQAVGLDNATRSVTSGTTVYTISNVKS